MSFCSSVLINVWSLETIVTRNTRKGGQKTLTNYPDLLPWCHDYHDQISIDLGYPLYD